MCAFRKKTEMRNTKITTFDFNEMPVRLLDMGGEPWFVAADVCRVLDIANSRDAVAQLDDDEKDVANADTLNAANVGDADIKVPNRGLGIVSESGLYSLVFRSRKEEARAFRRWVTKEVLPTIRKTGSFSAVGYAGDDEGQEAMLAMRSNAHAASMARDLVLDGRISLETAQVVSSLCSEVRSSWALRMKIRPASVPDVIEESDLADLVCEAVAKLDADGGMTMEELMGRKVDGGEMRSLGRRLAALRGMHFTDERGRRFCLGHRKTRTGVVYTVKFIGEEGK